MLAYPEGYAKPLIKVIEAALIPTLTLTLGLAGGRRAGTDGATMSVPTLFGLCAAGRWSASGSTA